MAYRKQTLRRMTPLQRRAARLANDTRSLALRARNLTEAIGELERETGARRRRDDRQVPVNACPECGFVWAFGDRIADGPSEPA